MKSFPSTFNIGGSSMWQQNKKSGSASATNNYYTTSGINTPFDLNRITSMNFNLNNITKQNLLKNENINIGENETFIQSKKGYKSLYDPMYKSSRNSKPLIYENPYTMSSSVLRSMNNYRFIYNVATKSLIDINHEGSSAKVLIGHTASSPALFNPLFNVQVLGMTSNVPLLNNISELTKKSYDNNITDCSIKELVRLSHKTSSILGHARYRYADFMYCKELGKISNNHLITLRKFSYPVGDNIFELTNTKYNDEKGDRDFDMSGDYARMITWFDTDDNKLENILKFDYEATWKPLESKIQQEDSREDEANTPLNKLANSTNISKDYSAQNSAGQFGNANLWTSLGTSVTNGAISGIGSKAGIQGGSQGYNRQMLYNYDNNKVYTPKNTVWDTNVYEGHLIFNNEFSLVFNYKLRAYDNINPKSALLDLIGNILECTYRRGKFWGGQQKLVGPSQNKAAWKKANAFIDNSWNKLGGFMKGFGSGALSLDDILSSMSSLSNVMGGMIQNTFTDIKNIASGGPQEWLSSLSKTVTKFNKVTGFSTAFKAGLKNSLGRPQLYAFDSLLSGDNVGLWHVTIGNPKNPIVSMGNLILTKSEMSFSGPLGIDDFPTDLKIVVTLKHGRGRDITDIGRMFTKGVNGLYQNIAYHKMSDFIKMSEREISNQENINRLRQEAKAEENEENQTNTAETTEKKKTEEASKNEQSNVGGATSKTNESSENMKSTPKGDLAYDIEKQYIKDEGKAALKRSEGESDYDSNGDLITTPDAQRIEQMNDTRTTLYRSVLSEYA